MSIDQDTIDRIAGGVVSYAEILVSEKRGKQFKMELNCLKSSRQAELDEFNEKWKHELNKILPEKLWHR